MSDAAPSSSANNGMVSAPSHAGLQSAASSPRHFASSTSLVVFHHGLTTAKGWWAAAWRAFGFRFPQVDSPTDSNRCRKPDSDGEDDVRAALVAAELSVVNHLSIAGSWVTWHRSQPSPGAETCCILLAPRPRTSVHKPLPVPRILRLANSLRTARRVARRHSFTADQPRVKPRAAAPVPDLSAARYPGKGQRLSTPGSSLYRQGCWAHSASHEPGFSDDLSGRVGATVVAGIVTHCNWSRRCDCSTLTSATLRFTPGGRPVGSLGDAA